MHNFYSTLGPYSLAGKNIFEIFWEIGKQNLKMCFGGFFGKRTLEKKICIAVSMFKLRFACSDDFFKAESMGSGTLQIQQVWDLVCASLSFRLAHTRPH